MTRWTLLIMSAVAAVGALAMSLTLRTQQQAGPPHKDVVLPGSVPATLYLPVDAAEEPPPVVIVGHGYSADRVTMSWFARTVASSGYAVLTIDFRGHGANENPLEGDLADDVESALDWIASSPDVDLERVAVMGHSMGSHAVLHFASEDPRPDAVVALGSGVTQPSGSRRPPNLLLLLAEREPGDLQEATDELLVQLAGPSAVAGRVYGDLERRDAVQLLRIEGADHVSVLWSGDLVNKTVAWLNSAFGAEEGESRLFVASAVGVALGGVLIGPVTFVFHRLVLSPQRLVLGGAMALLMIPFFMLFQVILRQGPTISAAVRSGVGHVLLVGVLAAAVMTGVMPGVVVLVLPLLVTVFVLVDIFGVAAYSRSGNAVLIGVVEAVWLAGISAAVMPIS